MKSGWFFGTTMWQEYLAEYAKSRPECLHEWKSSPLATGDHDFEDGYLYPGMFFDEHLSQVLDLRTHKWSDVRKSYRGLINQANKRLHYFEQPNAYHYTQIHIQAFGKCRSERTYSLQEQWVKDGHAFCLTSLDSNGEYAAAALWITYKECAYYASGPSLQDNVQHAMIWESLCYLKERGITLVELGQIDGETEKEKNIGKFKAGFGGEAKPFTIVRRKQ